MLKWLFFDCIHAVLWVIHGLLLFCSFVLIASCAVFLFPESWTQAWGHHWRWFLFGAALVSTIAFVVYLARRYRDQLGRPVVSFFRDRLNVMSFQWKGPVMGSQGHLKEFYRSAQRQWVSRLRLSMKGWWTLPLSWLPVLLGLLLSPVVQVPVSFYPVLIGLNSREQSQIRVQEFRLQFPSYTEREALQWEAPVPHPLRAEFIRGSSMSARMELLRQNASQWPHRMLLGSISMALEEDKNKNQWRVVSQLIDSAQLRYQECLWNRFWVSSAPLGQFTQVPDLVPQVTAVFMTESEKVVEGQPVRIRIHSTDDFGVRRIALRIVQEDRWVEELIKFYSIPIPEHMEDFDWDTTGVPLQSGPFTIEVIAADASPESREPPVGRSDQGKFEFVSLAEHFKTLTGLLEKWIAISESKLEEFNEPSKPILFSTYVSESEKIASELETESMSQSTHQILSQWSYLRLKLDPLMANGLPPDSSSREGILRALSQFVRLLKSLLERQNDESLDEMSASVWDSFEAFRESQRDTTKSDIKQRRMFREKLESDFKRWMESFEKMDNEVLKEWGARTQILENLKNVAENNETATAEQLKSMEDELSEGMAMWEKAATERDQKRLEEMRQRLGRIGESIQALVIQQMEIRKATQDLREKSPSNWDHVEKGQENLVQDMEPALEAGMEDLQTDPMTQFALQGLMAKAQGYMGLAQESLTGKNLMRSVDNQEKAIKSLLGAAQKFQQMMQQLGQQTQYSRGSHRDRGNYFKKTLNGPFEGPKEYRDALRRNLREERSSPLKERERKVFFQRLIK